VSTRRDFIRHAAALGIGGFSAKTFLDTLAATPAEAAAAQANAQRAMAPGVDLAEWSYFWIGVEQAHLARGTTVNGKQMYVEYWIPALVRHPLPIVLVHGGGGQGLDWMGTPDGRPGWVTLLVQEGFKVYVVDRPGHGRSPFHPDLHGPFPAQTNTLEAMSGQFTPPNASRPAVGPYRPLHNQWPGAGEVGSPDLDQLVASQGGTYVGAVFPGGPAPAGAGGRGGGAPQGGAPAAAAAAPPPVDGGTAAGAETAHMVWRQRGAMLLDKIGPAIIMTHSAGGPFGWLVAEVRPNLVKGIICIEGGGTPFGGQNIWGMSTIPVAYDPPASDPSDIKTRMVTPTEPGVQPYRLQEEPARKLKNLQSIPIVIVTAEASFASPGNPGAVAYFKQAGCRAEELRLVDHAVHGNGHMMMVEKNNRQVLQPILDWIQKNVSTSGARASSASSNGKKSETAMKLADQGFFWVGTEHKKMPYGTIISGQMYVQYLIPAQMRHPYPVVLVHGGSGQMLHYMGTGDGAAGWAHYYVQEGYRVFLVDRPGQGRAPYHPDALGPIGPHPTYAAAVAEFKRGTGAPNRRWPGTGDVSDPLVDQFMASQNSPPQDQAMAQALWRSRGAALLDKIGPAIVQTHSAGGPFGWLVADERPNLVKAIVCVEGAGFPFETLTHLPRIPIVYITGERSGRTQGAAIVASLRQAGCEAEDLQLKDRGILGNGHFMMFENNRRQVFDVIRAWIDQKLPAKSS
jgi:pimeloyl-ACP methyl ester carboxylesterase